MVEQLHRGANKTNRQCETCRCSREAISHARIIALRLFQSREERICARYFCDDDNDERRRERDSNCGATRFVPPNSSDMAEGVGFEPTRPFWGLTVFKTAGFNRSPTPPAFQQLTIACAHRA